MSDFIDTGIDQDGSPEIILPRIDLEPIEGTYGLQRFKVLAAGEEAGTIAFSVEEGPTSTLTIEELEFDDVDTAAAALLAVAGTQEGEASVRPDHQDYFPTRQRQLWHALEDRGYTDRSNGRPELRTDLNVTFL